MTEHTRLVSAVIPVRNGAAFLAGAIENVLAQDYQPLEIIVVDDGSTDATADIASGYQDAVHYALQTAAGPSAARNRGIKLARGNLIAFLDVDDLWSSNKLNLQAEYLLANPGVEIVQGHIQNILLTGTAAQNGRRFGFEPTSAPYRYINVGSALYRGSVFDKVGPFDESMTDNEDVDWFIRAWEQGISKVVLDEVTLFYRQHAENMSRHQAPVNFGLTKLVKKHMDRCRTGSTFRAGLRGGYPGVAEYLGRPPEQSGSAP